MGENTFPVKTFIENLSNDLKYVLGLVVYDIVSESCEKCDLQRMQF